MPLLPVIATTLILSAANEVGLDADGLDVGTRVGHRAQRSPAAHTPFCWHSSTSKQTVLAPSKPGLQVHMKLLTVSAQAALVAQSCLYAMHIDAAFLRFDGADVQKREREG